jgi:two-component system response regulator
VYQTIDAIDVFVGEANDGHAELVEASLQETGIVKNLFRGRDGEEILALVRATWGGYRDSTSTPLLVLLDCGLPSVGALDVLGVLKSNWLTSWLPVIMMTTTDDKRRAEEYRHLGCDAYVTKWAVFLGLPSFVTRVRCLMNKAVRTASCRRVIAHLHGSGASALDVRSVSDAVRFHWHRGQRFRKEVGDGSAV